MRRRHSIGVANRLGCRGLDAQRLGNAGRLARNDGRGHDLRRRCGLCLRCNGGRRSGPRSGRGLRDDRRGSRGLLSRSRLDLGRRLDGRGRDGTGGQERQRVDVSLLLRRHADAEVDVGLRQLDGAAGPDSADDGALAHDRAPRDPDRPEMDKRRRVTERRLDRNGLAAGRHRAREGDDSPRRRDDLRPRGSAQVDPAVLSACVRMRTVEGERSQHRAVDRPCPGLRRRDRQPKGTQDQHHSESPHEKHSFVVRIEN